MAARKAIALLVARLGEQFPGFNPTAQTVDAWDRVLGRYTDEQLESAGDSVARTHTFGPPSTAHIVEALEGRIERVQIPVTDQYNRKVLKQDGSPAYRWENRRVFPDGSTAPLALPAHETHREDWRSGQIARLGDGLTEVFRELDSRSVPDNPERKPHERPRQTLSPMFGDISVEALKERIAARRAEQAQ